jgi:hypothetical protein
MTHNPRSAAEKAARLSFHINGHEHVAFALYEDVLETAHMSCDEFFLWPPKDSDLRPSAASFLAFEGGLRVPAARPCQGSAFRL